MSKEAGGIYANVPGNPPHMEHFVSRQLLDVKQAGCLRMSQAARSTASVGTENMFLAALEEIDTIAKTLRCLMNSGELKHLRRMQHPIRISRRTSFEPCPLLGRLAMDHLQGEPLPRSTNRRVNRNSMEYAGGNKPVDLLNPVLPAGNAFSPIMFIKLDPLGSHVEFAELEVQLASLFQRKEVGRHRRIGLVLLRRAHNGASGRSVSSRSVPRRPLGENKGTLKNTKLPRLRRR